MSDNITLSLSPWERATLLGYLPRRVSYHEGMMIQEIRGILDLTEEEKEKYNVSYLQNGSLIEFGEGEKSVNDLKSFELSKGKYKIIKDALKKANKESNLINERDMFVLYDKVMDAEET